MNGALKTTSRDDSGLQQTAFGRSKGTGKEPLEAQGGRADVLGRAAHQNCPYKAQDSEGTFREPRPRPG